MPLVTPAYAVKASLAWRSRVECFRGLIWIVEHPDLLVASRDCRMLALDRRASVVVRKRRSFPR